MPEYGSKQDRYIPAFSYGWLTAPYDLITRLTMREFTFKRRLVDQARITKGERVLDLGCGTATLTILIKESHPEAEVIGLDGDPKVLEIARTKTARAGLDITLERGIAFELPYADSSFDRVFSSLLFHHLTRENKRRTLGEVFRVLKPGGEFYLADFGKPNNVLMYLISLVMRHFEEYQDNSDGLLPKFIEEAGFEPVREFTRYLTVFGSLSLYYARKRFS